MNKRTFTIAFLIISLVAVSASTAVAQTKKIQKLADEYSLALSVYEKQTARSTVESLLRKGSKLDESTDELESLSADDYAALEKTMRGFVVNREETVYIEPDLKFFADLSRTHGTKADSAFFALMRQIRPENVWAAYLEQQTDYSGCTLYGNGVLTALYGKILNFKRNYPKAFTPEIKEETDGILNQFSEEGCACGKRESVLKEFRLFIKTYPTDKNTPQIKKRLAMIQKSKKFRFNCQSG